MKYFFRCKPNPSAPLLVLESYWEMDEMKNHPDYERVDEHGVAVPDEAADAPHPIPFKAVGAKR